jgi:competence protein ComEC
VAVGLAGAVGWRAARELPATDIGRRLERRDQNVTLRGVVLDDDGDRFRMAVEAVDRGAGWEELTGRVLVFVSEGVPAPAVRYGQRVECAALLRVAAAASNPGQFDWRGWLERRGIFFTATIRPFDYLKVLGPGRAPPLKGWALRLREVCLRSLRLGVGADAEWVGILAAMVLGERSEIPAGTYSEFQRTGVFHVFAISGLHVALVSGVVVAALRMSRLPRRWCAVVAIPLLVLFVLATGARPGAQRALAMACVWLVGWMAVRPVDGLNTFGAAALGVLVVDPGQLWDGGFQMSVAAVWALLVMAQPVERWLERWVGLDPWVAPVAAPWWWRGMEPLVRWGRRLVSCSVAAWVGLIPLLAMYFNLFTPVSLLANLVVVPALGLHLALGMASLLVGPWWEWGAGTLNHANVFALEAMTAAVRWLSRLPGGHWFVTTPAWWQVAGFYGVVAWVVSQRVPPRWKWAGLGAAAAVGAGLWVVAWRQPVVEVTVLDMPDGVAVFVNPPGTGGDFLVNGGTEWGARRTVLPFLRSQGVDRLAAQMLTRGDKAHAAGLVTVMRELPVGEAIHSGTGSRSKFFWSWLSQVRQQGQPVRVMAAGAERTWPGGLRLRVWHPPPWPASERSDDNSTVWSLEFGPTRMWFASDVGATVERSLRPPRAQIVVLGRHGLEESATDEFLDQVQPEVVIQLVGTRPMTRYPWPQTRERIEQRQIRYLATSETGAVTVRLTPAGYRIRTCRPTEAPLGRRG